MLEYHDILRQDNQAIDNRHEGIQERVHLPPYEWSWQFERSAGIPFLFGPPLRKGLVLDLMEVLLRRQ